MLIVRSKETSHCSISQPLPEIHKKLTSLTTQKKIMKKTIEKYKKFIWMWSIINLLALFVNSFNIEGDLTNKHELFFLFTNSYGDSGFWPLVKFVEFHDQFSTYGTHDNDYTSFNGIFYQYDISEFLFYIGIIIAFLIYKAYIEKPSAVKITKS